MIAKILDQSAPFALTFVWDRRTVAQTRRHRKGCDSQPVPDLTSALCSGTGSSKAERESTRIGRQFPTTQHIGREAEHRPHGG